MKDTVEKWHTRKEFSLAIILAIVTQVSFGIWYASKLDSRVASIESSIIQLSATAPENKEWQVVQRQKVWDRVASMQSVVNTIAIDMQGMRVNIDNINRNLDRLTDRALGDNKKVSK